MHLQLLLPLLEVLAGQLVDVVEEVPDAGKGRGAVRVKQRRGDDGVAIDRPVGEALRQDEHLLEVLHLVVDVPGGERVGGGVQAVPVAQPALGGRPKAVHGLVHVRDVDVVAGQDLQEPVGLQVLHALLEEVGVRQGGQGQHPALGQLQAHPQRWVFKDYLSRNIPTQLCRHENRFPRQRQP